MVKAVTEKPAPRRRIDPDCATCRRDTVAGDRMMPYHDPSPQCESGKHPHCTCDTCF